MRSNYETARSHRVIIQHTVYTIEVTMYGCMPSVCTRQKNIKNDYMNKIPRNVTKRISRRLRPRLPMQTSRFVMILIMNHNLSCTRELSIIKFLTVAKQKFCFVKLVILRSHEYCYIGKVSKLIFGMHPVASQDRNTEANRCSLTDLPT